jgi:hypothetical protein
MFLWFFVELNMVVLFICQCVMEPVIVFTARSILAISVAEIGGTEHVLVNVLSNGSFRVRVSFVVPSLVDGDLMEEVVVVGEIGTSQYLGEESACVTALRVLWQERGYSVLDYSLFCVWSCKERYYGLLEKMQQSKSIFEDISGGCFDVIDSILSAFVLFLQSARDLRQAGADPAISQAATSCVPFLQMMYVRGGTVRDSVMGSFEAMDNHENFDDVLASAGFVVPANDVCFLWSIFLVMLGAIGR